MNTEEVVDHMRAIQNLAALYGYEIVRQSDFASSRIALVDFEPVDAGGAERIMRRLRGHMYWTLDKWIQFFKINTAVGTVEPK